MSRYLNNSVLVMAGVWELQYPDPWGGDFYLGWTRSGRPRAIFFSIGITALLHGLVSLAVVVLAKPYCEIRGPLHDSVNRKTSILSVGPRKLPPTGSAPAPRRGVPVRTGMPIVRSMRL